MVHIALVGIMATAPVCVLAAGTEPGSNELAPRDYHIETALVRAGQAEAVIVSSSRRPGYVDTARELRKAVKERTGVDLPIVYAEQVEVADVLGKTNAIVLGNLVTSRFVETLYWQWYSLLDLWYPGPGGYVLRTLHDPYGTGKNVIFIGGSDDQGVADAAKAFMRTLVEADPGRIPRLMEITLGPNHTMPPEGEWIDPRLRGFCARLPVPIGHTEMSRAGLIYYYSGNEWAGRFFREKALHSDVLTSTDHYSAHMHAIVWDLIEEGPVFSDEDRETITAKLLEFARGKEGMTGIGRIESSRDGGLLLNRHISMQANCTLTTSRYFNKYWPSKEWENNLRVVQSYFDRQMTSGKADSDLGGSGIYTYLDSVLIPALLLCDRRFIDSGALRHFAELCLMHCDNTGYMPYSGQNHFYSFPRYTFLKCATLLNDGRFLCMMKRREEAERIGGFNNIDLEFAVGRAWATSVTPKPMKKLSGVYHLPLTAWEHEVRGQCVPIEKSLDKLTMRTGFGRDDQYLLLDGLYGGPDEKPWPNVNSIVNFGQNGRVLLVSDIGGQNPVNHNVVSVSKDGFVVPSDRAASLEATADLPTFGYAHSRVAKYVHSSWDRHIFWRKGKWLVVLDRLIATDEGRCGLACQWRTIGEPEITGSDFTSTVWEWSKEQAPRDVLNIKNAKKLPLRYSEQFTGLFGPPETQRWEHYCQRKSINRMRQVVSRHMKPGDEQVFANLLYVGGDRTGSHYEIIAADEYLNILSGDEHAYVGFTAEGCFQRNPLTVEAAAFCISASSVSLVRARHLAAHGTDVAFSEPCNVDLALATGRMTVEVTRPVSVEINGEVHQVAPGVSRFSIEPWTAEQIANSESRMRKEAAAASPAKPPLETVTELPPISTAWTFEVGTSVLATLSEDIDEDGQAETLLGLKNGEVVCLDAHGKPRWRFETNGPVPALAHGSFDSGSAVIIGSDDEHVYAVSPDNGEVVWEHKCEVPPDRLRLFPWWTMDGKAKVQAFLVDDLDQDGHAEIICGTGGGCVEVLSGAGTRKWITPIEWGIPDRFDVMTDPDGSKFLLVDNSFSSCGSTTWTLAPDGRTLSNNAYKTGRVTWDMATVPCLKVVDLEVDGKLEVLIGRSGAYNEIALYDGHTGQQHWLHTPADAVRAVDVLDVDGDGVKEVIVGSRSGWLFAFDRTGGRTWGAEMPHEVTAVAVSSEAIYVACADKMIYRVSTEGKPQARYAMNGLPLWRFAQAGSQLIAVDASGHVAALHTRSRK